jgi:hypothetical protein
VPIAAAACARWALPVWVERAPLVLSLALVALVGNASAVRRLRAIARAVHRPRPARARDHNDGEAPFARDAHAAAGDVVR